MNYFSKYFEYFLKIVALFLIFLLIKIVLNSIRKRFIKLYEKSEIYKKRLTLTKLLFSVLDYLFIFLFIWYFLKIFNIDTTPLLAVSGIAGVAIGFAGQTFFKDAIAGIFLILENYYSVGDTIEIDGIFESVEEIGIRTTVLRNYEGKLFYIPNSEIRKVIKYGYGEQSIVISVPISYESDIDKAKSVLDNVGKNLLEKNEIIDNLVILGVNDLGTSGIEILVKLKVDKDKRWSAKRKFLEEIKKPLIKRALKFLTVKWLSF